MSAAPQIQDAANAWPPRRVILMRCSADACRQGREPCPCPDACEVLGGADDARLHDACVMVDCDAVDLLLMAVVMVLGAAALAGALMLLTAWTYL